MKYAILSDIHANPNAAQIAYRDAKAHGCKRFVCLGDVVGYGPDPSGAIKFVQERFDTCILGNHDAGLVGTLNLSWFVRLASTTLLKHSTMVSDVDKEWLSNLEHAKQESFRDVNVLFAHGSGIKNDPFDYIDSRFSAREEFVLMNESGFTVEFVGHTHCAMVFETITNSNSILDIRVRSAIPDITCPYKTETFTISPGISYIFNAGSVGYPRNQPFSVYCIFDTDKMTVQYRTIPFDFGDYACDLEEAGIHHPHWLEDRLYSGYEEIPQPESNI